MHANLSPVIRVDAEKCVNCHRCIDVCPVKFCNNGSGDYIELNSDLCIGCGSCIDVCQHNARLPLNDMNAFLQGIQSGESMIAIAAPAIAASFPNQYLHINGWLNSMGVKAVFDVSFGAELTIKSYLEHIKKNNPKCVIAQPCPALVNFIEIYVPELLPYLAPADSPMIHTIKMIREYYPQYRQAKVLVLSPCIAKKREFEAVQLGDYNVTFQSLDQYFKENHIELTQYRKKEFDNPPAERAVLFSSPGGLMRTAEREIPGISSKIRKIEGVHSVYDYLRNLYPSIQSGEAPLIVDCLSCEKGCNGGPGTLTRDMHPDQLERRIEKRADLSKKQYKPKGILFFQKESSLLKKHINAHWKPGLYSRSYTSLNNKNVIKIPDKKTLSEIYIKTNKTNPSDFLHCGSCGYHNCEEMAIALHNGLTKPENCRHYVEQIAARETKAVLEAKDQLVRDNNTHTDYLGYISGKLSDLSKKSDNIKEAITESIDITQKAFDSVNQTAECMKGLNDSTGKITELLQVIRDISDKINMLGLNATIEAARAGEVGRGFTVVAEEIQKLAHSSHDEITRITDSLDEIARHTQKASSMSQHSVSTIHQATGISSIIAEILADQTDVITNMAEDSTTRNKL